jgi:hypothetical protein
MNNINVNQNSESALRKLKAQSYLYSYAKKVFALQSILTVPLVVCLTLIAVFFPPFKIVSATWGILMTLFDLLFLKNYIQSLKQKAATIQELFDSEVLEFEWQEIKIDSIPTSDEIFEFSKKYKKQEKNYEKLLNWYPQQLETLPLVGAQVICQYLNCWWDLNLRKKYKNILIILLISFLLTIFIIGLINEQTISQFILFSVLPVMPAVILGIRQINENAIFISKASKVKSIAHKLWTTLLNHSIDEATLTKKIRALQDEIYDRRYNNPLIFDFIYWRLREKQEREMNEISNDLVSEFNTANDQKL